MRRLDLRPAKKLRNAQRHLRQLAQWPERIVAELPSPELSAGERFWNFKVPVYSKLVDPPHATDATKRACISAIFAAADAIEHARGRPADCRVACLVSSPSLFQSEVTLFWDEDYFRTFLPPEDASRHVFDGGWVEAEPAEDDEIVALAPSAPAGLERLGGVLMRQYDPVWGPEPVSATTWVWAYPRR